jgi:hypothetical protein
VANEPATYELLRSARRSAVHLEMRDGYTPTDPAWLDWQAGNRFDPANRAEWRGWFDLIAAAVARGVIVRRARIVSEPVSTYIHFEYDVTAGHNVAAGEMVRWLPRQQAPDLLVPVSDFWLIDDRVVVWNHFAGDGSWVTEETCDEPQVAKVCASSFEAVWDRAIPHEEYQPA